MTVVAVVLAAGRGTRTGLERPKQLVGLHGRPVVRHSVEVLAAHPGVHEVWLVASKDVERELGDSVADVVDRVVQGGATRADSVAAAVRRLGPEVDRVLVHDAARPGLPTEVVDRVLAALDGADAVATVVPVPDTVVLVEDGQVLPGPDRESLRALQTPQGFRLEALRAAHLDRDAAITFTDDVSCVRDLVAGSRVVAVAGDPRLHKITRVEDFAVVEALLSAAQERPEARPGA